MIVLASSVVMIPSASTYAATKVVTAKIPGNGQPMAAKTDAAKTIHLIFDTSNGPQYAASRDNGKTLSKPIPLVDQGARKPGLEFLTWDMAVTADGTVHVALGNNAWKLKLPKEEWGYFYTSLQPGEKAFAPLRNINHTPSEGFSLAVDDHGIVSAIWMADKLFANISQDGGKNFAETVEIDPMLNPCNCCTTSCAYGSDGRLAILYREETNNERDMYVALWDQKQNSVTKSRVSTTPWVIDSCPMTYYSINRSVDGYVIAWPTKGQIYFARLDADGGRQSPQEVKTPGSNGMRTGIVTIPTPDGQTLVLWNKDDQIGWQLYDNRGRASGGPGSAKTTGKGAAGVLAKNGELVVFQ